MQQTFGRKFPLVLDEKSSPESEAAAADRLWNEREVARYLNVSVASIRRRRLLRQPPDFVKVGSSVRYEQASVHRVVQEGRREAVRD